MHNWQISGATWRLHQSCNSPTSSGSGSDGGCMDRMRHMICWCHTSCSTELWFSLAARDTCDRWTGMSDDWQTDRHERQLTDGQTWMMTDRQTDNGQTHMVDKWQTRRHGWRLTDRQTWLTTDMTRNINTLMDKSHGWRDKEVTDWTDRPNDQ